MRSRGRLAYRYRGGEGAADTGPAAVAAVRLWGGVLEHPTDSKLWQACSMPAPGAGPDRWGGYTLQVRQVDWGHPCVKSTWLYVVGVDPADLPPMPAPREPTHVIATRLRLGAPGRLPDLPKSKRHLTPPAFAAWLVELARRVTLEPRP